MSAMQWQCNAANESSPQRQRSTPVSMNTDMHTTGECGGGVICNSSTCSHVHSTRCLSCRSNNHHHHPEAEGQDGDALQVALDRIFVEYMDTCGVWSRSYTCFLFRMFFFLFFSSIII